jgi:erythromycin esterase-like protein
MRRFVLVAVIVMAAGCGDSSVAPLDGGVDEGATDGGVEASPRVALNPLGGIAPSDDMSDLAPLAPIVAPADVVGIGESVHTAGGELLMRTRLIEYLVGTMGFRLLAFESERTPVGLLVEAYVQTCVGTPEDAAHYAINPIWWEVSTPPVLQWLCQWNVDHPNDRVHAMGFDIHQPWYDYPAIKAYLEVVAPAQAAGLTDGMYLCLGAKYASQEEFFADPNNLAYYNGDGVHVVPQADHDACQADATATVDLLTNRHDDLVANSERSFELARIAVEGLRAYDTTIFLLSRGHVDNAPRDRAMFEVFRTIRRLDFPGTRAILWAHNGHIAQHSDEIVGSQWEAVKNLGTLIAEDVGGRYAAIGQSAYVTHYNWMVGPRQFTASMGSLEELLDQFGQPLLLVDMLAATTGDAPLIDPTEKLPVAIDNTFPKAYPARHLDALVFQHECPGPEYFTPPPWFQGY